MKQILKGIKNHIVNGDTDDSLRKMEICNSCEEKYSSSLGDRCGLCGCIIKFKVKSDSKCPLNKF